MSGPKLWTAAGPTAVKMALKKLDLSYLDGLYRNRPAISLQEYVVGRPANRAVVCHRGEVLAGLSVEALQTSDATGPATVIRVLDSPEMSDAAARMLRLVESQSPIVQSVGAIDLQGRCVRFHGVGSLQLFFVGIPWVYGPNPRLYAEGDRRLSYRNEF